MKKYARGITGWKKVSERETKKKSRSGWAKNNERKEEVKMRKMLMLLSPSCKEPPGVCVSARAHCCCLEETFSQETSIEGLLYLLRGNSTAPCYLANSWDKLKKKPAGWSMGRESCFLFVFLECWHFKLLSCRWWLFEFCFETSPCPSGICGDLLPGRGQTHDPVPFDVALHLGLLAKGTGDSSGKVWNIIHLQQKLKERRRRFQGSNVRLVWCIGTIDGS